MTFKSQSQNMLAVISPVGSLESCVAVIMIHERRSI